MDQGQHLHPGLARHGGGLANGGMARVGGALRLLFGEAGVVDEQLGAAGGLGRRLARRGVAGDDHGAAGARLPHHVLGADRAGSPLDLLAALQRGEGRAFRHAEPLRGIGVETTGPVLLDQRVAAGANAVLDREGAHLASLERDRVAGLQLDQFQLEPDPPDDPGQRLEQAAQAARPIDGQRRPAVGQVVCLQQPRQAEEVVGVEVGEVDLVDLGQTQRALKLALRPFPAVEHQPLPPARHQQARGRAPRRGHRAAGAEEDHREIHGAASLRDREAGQRS